MINSYTGSRQSASDEECLQALRITDPENDKKRIIQLKGGLLKEVYEWIEANDKFKLWEEQNERALLWITGLPGQGKTMLLCGIIDSLPTKSTIYFFFQATDARLNSGISALRGLIFMLATQRRELVQHIRAKYDEAGASIFADTNSWFALESIFKNMLNDIPPGEVNIVVDAVNECMIDRDRLLDLIIRCNSEHMAKWIVSSRPWAEIEIYLERIRGEARLALEARENEAIITDAVSRYIEQKVVDLHALRSYKAETMTEVSTYLKAHASGTFLWAALMCARLEHVNSWNILKVLKQMPKTLENLYKGMMTRLLSSEDAELLRQILATVTAVYRPLNIPELATLTDLPEELITSPDQLTKLMQGYCDFLVLRNGTIQFVHASAQEYVLSQGSEQIFPQGINGIHEDLFQRSISAMSAKLKRGMCNIKQPETHIEQASKESLVPTPDLLYPLLHWSQHFCAIDYETNLWLNARQTLQNFLKNYYIYWLEAMSLTKHITQAITMIDTLFESLSSVKLSRQDPVASDALLSFVYDAQRFLFTFAGIIEDFPAQVYYSALVFSPSQSLIKQAFRAQLPEWLSLKTLEGEDYWSHCLRAFQGHADVVHKVIFSDDGKLLASASRDGVVQLRDPSSGIMLATLRTSGPIAHLKFCAGGSKLCSVNASGHIELWSCPSLSSNMTIFKQDDNLQTLPTIAFMQDGELSNGSLATGHDDGTIRLWDLNTGACQQKINAHSGPVTLLAASKSGKLLVSGSEFYLKFRELKDLRQEYIIEGLPSTVDTLEFSPDDKWLAYSGPRCAPSWIKLTDSPQIQPFRTCQTNDRSFAFGPDHGLICVTDAAVLKVVDMQTWEIRRTVSLGGNERAIAISPDGKRLASGGLSSAIFLWDLDVAQNTNQVPADTSSTARSCPSLNYSLRFSPSGNYIMSMTPCKDAALFRVSEPSKPVLTIHGSCVDYTFAGDRYLGVGYTPAAIQIFSISNKPESRPLLYLQPCTITVMCFSPNDQLLLVGDGAGALRFLEWDKADNQCRATRRVVNNGAVIAIAFKHDGKQFVTAGTSEYIIKVWCTDSRNLISSISTNVLPGVLEISPSGLDVALSHPRGFAVYDLQSKEQKYEIIADYNDRTSSLSRQFSYSADGKYTKSKDGVWLLDGAGDNDGAKDEISQNVYIKERWIYQGSEKLLLIPPEYGIAADTYGRTVVLGHGLGTRLMIFDIHRKGSRTHPQLEDQQSTVLSIKKQSSSVCAIEEPEQEEDDGGIPDKSNTTRSDDQTLAVSTVSSTNTILQPNASGTGGQNRKRRKRKRKRKRTDSEDVLAVESNKKVCRNSGDS